MNILAFDTTSDILSVAFRNDSGTRSWYDVSGMHHTERLMPVIASLTGGEKPDLVVCPSGPGSFTGLRIGMATAKGLAAGYGCPMVSIPTFDPWGWSLRSAAGLVVAAMDARKKRFYAAVFRGGERVTDDLDASAEAIFDRLEGAAPVVFTGPHAALLFSLIATTGRRTRAAAAKTGVEPTSAHDWSVDPRCRTGIAPMLLEIGERTFAQRGADADDAAPHYVRESDAEISVRRRSDAP